MKALIIGGSGQVGGQLTSQLITLGREVITTHLKHPAPDSLPLNITDKNAVHRLISEIQPTHIYLPASATNVDECERDPKGTFPVNVAGIQSVVEAANHVHARLIYFSTDYIFDGSKGPYTEFEPPSPICEYGRQKVYAEHHIGMFSKDFLIIRTTVVFGWERQQKNFVIRLIKSLREKIEVRVPNDQIGSPTYAPNLAKAAIQLGESQEQGIVNITGPETVSRYQFALETARIFGLPAEYIIPVDTKSLGQAAPRPLRLGLLVDKASKLLNFPLTRYKDGLREMAEQSASHL